MSADSEVAILETIDNFIQYSKEPICYYNNSKKKICYRVALVQGLSELEAYWEKEEPYNVGIFLKELFGKSEVYYDLESAYKRAQEIYDDVGWTEYGITSCIRHQYSFPIY